MELKEFIKTVLKDITEAVSESQKENPSALIAPMVSASNPEFVCKDTSERKITNINFRVGLMSDDQTGGKAGIGVFLDKISIGAEKSKSQDLSSVTWVEFSVPVAFLTIPSK